MRIFKYKENREIYLRKNCLEDHGKFCLCCNNVACFGDAHVAKVITNRATTKYLIRYNVAEGKFQLLNYYNYKLTLKSSLLEMAHNCKKLKETYRITLFMYFVVLD
jgi:hypothetical protein